MNSLPRPILMPFKGIWPKIHETAFVAPGVVVTGDVEIEAGANIWFGCVLRGDVHIIRIGKNTNIQDGTVIHGTRGSQGTLIGSNVTVGHCALLHDCTLEDASFVGMKACVMDGARVETHGMLAAGALLTPGKTVKSGQLWAGSPAKYWRDMTDDDIRMIDERARNYVELAAEYA